MAATEPAVARSFAEIIYSVYPTLDVGQSFTEVLVSSTNPTLDVGQSFTEVLVSSTNPTLQVGQSFIEVLVRNGNNIELFTGIIT